jgi:hypothetical protein
VTDIYLHNKQIKSVFELLGNKENDITYSIGWTLANSHAFLMSFTKKVLPKTSYPKEAIIRLQEFKQDSGITDIEIQGMDFHIIAEAKRGWYLPSNDQLNLYARRLKAADDRQNIIVVMSECLPEYALLHLPRHIQGIPVRYLSWEDIAFLSETVREASHAEKRLLEQLRIYLRRIVNMQNQESNMVYVVSLGSGIPEGCSISWIDIVAKKHSYFHPVAKGWPASPPNYLGFRYHGVLQKIHHVDSWKIVDDLHSEIKEIGAGLWKYPHYFYKLGPTITPNREVKNGRVYPSGRVWAMLDLLLTCDTVSDARDWTNKRLREK